MRRFPVAIAIVSVTILSCVLSLIHIKNTKEKYEAILNETYSLVVSNDIQAAKEKLNFFSEKWEKDTNLLMLIIQKKDIDDISFAAESIIEYIETKELPEFRAELKELTALLNHLWEKEVPSFKNIF